MSWLFDHWNHSLFTDSPYLFDYISDDSNVGIDSLGLPVCIDPNLGYFTKSNFESIKFSSDIEKIVFFKNATTLMLTLNLISNDTARKMCDFLFNLKFLNAEFVHEKAFTPTDYKTLLIACLKQDKKWLAIYLVENQAVVDFSLDLALQHGSFGWFCYTLFNYRDRDITCERAFLKNTIKNMEIAACSPAEDEEEQFEYVNIDKDSSKESVKCDISFSLFREAEEFLNSTFYMDAKKQGYIDLKKFFFDKLMELNTDKFLLTYFKNKTLSLEKKLITLFIKTKYSISDKDSDIELSSISESDEEDNSE